MIPSEKILKLPFALLPELVTDSDCCHSVQELLFNDLVNICPNEPIASCNFPGTAVILSDRLIVIKPKLPVESGELLAPEFKILKRVSLSVIGMSALFIIAGTAPKTKSPNLH